MGIIRLMSSQHTLKIVTVTLIALTHLHFSDCEISNRDHRLGRHHIKTDIYMNSYTSYLFTRADGISAQLNTVESLL